MLRGSKRRRAPRQCGAQKRRRARCGWAAERRRQENPHLPMPAPTPAAHAQMGAEAAMAPSMRCGYFILNQAASMPP